MVRIAALGLILAVAWFGVACGDESGEGVAAEATDAVEKAAKGLEENIEKSNRVYEETYDEARERGEDAIDAAGDAYNAVLEIPEEEKKAP